MLIPWQADRCFIIGEVAQAHDGSLGMAHAFIDAIANTGAHAVKFQTHIASAESTARENWRVKFSRQDATRYDYWRRMEFTAEQWDGLARHAEERKIIFMSSPFSTDAVSLLDKIGMPVWKIASGEVSNRPLLEQIARTERPIILSSGMSNLDELDSAVGWIKPTSNPLAVLQCTTAYPCPPEKVGLNMLDILRDRYKCAVGLSDHSATIYAGLAAATLGAEIIEVHVALSREMFGPDVSSSLTTAELKQLVEGCQFISRMRVSPINKDALHVETEPLRKLFGKSLVVTRDLSAGHVLMLSDIAAKKPGDGEPASRLSEFVGRRLKLPLNRDELLLEDNVDQPEK